MTILNSNKNKKDNFLDPNQVKFILVRILLKRYEISGKKDVAMRSPGSTPKSINLYKNLIWDRRRYTVCLPLKLQSDFQLDYFFSFLS